jgi:hypothetical protein
MNTNEAINGLKYQATVFKCNHEEYREGCGLFCSARLDVASDMTGRRDYCNKECPYYSKPLSTERAEAILKAMDNIRKDTITELIDYICNHPTVTNVDIVRFLENKREETYGT